MTCLQGECSALYGRLVGLDSPNQRWLIGCLQHPPAMMMRLRKLGLMLTPIMNLMSRM